MPEKKYKRIGWIVEIRSERASEWVLAIGSVRKKKTMAIKWFGASMYHGWQVRGLARCVPVYVQVEEA